MLAKTAIRAPLGNMSKLGAKISTAFAIRRNRLLIGGLCSDGKPEEAMKLADITIPLCKKGGKAYARILECKIRATVSSIDVATGDAFANNEKSLLLMEMFAEQARLAPTERNIKLAKSSIVMALNANIIARLTKRWENVPAKD